MEIKYVEGDLFQAIRDIKSVVVIAHCCNDVPGGAWGAGFVVPLARHFPLSRDWYFKWAKEDTFQLGNIQIVDVAENRIVCNMIGQHGVGWSGGKPPIRYDAIESCLDKLYLRLETAKLLDKVQLHCPAFGSNLAGGDFSLISLMIQHLWCDRGLPTTIYYLPGTDPRKTK